MIFTIDHYRFKYSLVGASQQPVILFLHGFMGSSEDFEEVVDLVSLQFGCLRVDLPGHGQTEVSQDTDYQMANTARGLIGLLRKLNISSCFLAGYSMGGRIALYLTLNFPQYFSGVVLESASPGLKTLAKRRLRIKQDSQLIEKLETIELDLFLEQWYKSSLFNSFRQHHNYSRAIARRLQNNPAKLAKSLLQLGLGQQPSLWQQLSRNKVAILLLVGKLDCKFVGINQEIASLCPQSKLKIVANSGHNIHFEQPQVYCQLLAKFIHNLG